MLNKSVITDQISNTQSRLNLSQVLTNGDFVSIEIMKILEYIKSMLSPICRQILTNEPISTLNETKLLLKSEDKSFQSI